MATDQRDTPVLTAATCPIDERSENTIRSIDRACNTLKERVAIKGTRVQNSICTIEESVDQSLIPKWSAISAGSDACAVYDPLDDFSHRDV